MVLTYYNYLIYLKHSGQYLHEFGQPLLQTSTSLSELIMTNTPNYRMTNNSSSTSTIATSPYPYPANLNISNLISLDLALSNYHLSRTQVKNLMESQDLGGFINGDAPPLMPWIILLLLHLAHRHVFGSA